MATLLSPKTYVKDAPNLGQTHEFDVTIRLKDSVED